MGFLMSAQPTENWLAIVAFVLSGANFVGLGALFAWVSDRKRKDR